MKDNSILEPTPKLPNRSMQTVQKRDKISIKGGHKVREEERGR